ncbi:MAG: PepSY-associated TM helix domain-containing protein [Melioribacteraceae bacterium]|nr:PepSY-associated TM helix domain-containing protein [Melioribacteraceae bacterium]MCO6474301.1 PepSY-associated TM helix domain-containing protein [Melioribacteraceae bacterium]MDD3557226.1 PepSY-associated TM helix domain-containing protein [Melioribacteraceae bacterium]
MKWRKIVRIVHRDFGYLAVGLTIIYAISGIAVNHIDEWNSNYIIEKTEETFPANPDSTMQTADMIDYVLNYIETDDTIKNSFRSSPVTVDIFFEGKTVQANISTGIARIETVESRRFFRETNFLHLNVPKKTWTYVADGFAIILIMLAITGIFMIKGKNGITGRGKWLTIIGFLIPIIFILIYF